MVAFQGVQDCNLEGWHIHGAVLSSPFAPLYKVCKEWCVEPKPPPPNRPPLTSGALPYPPARTSSLLPPSQGTQRCLEHARGEPTLPLFGGGGGGANNVIVLAALLQCGRSTHGAIHAMEGSGLY